VCIGVLHRDFSQLHLICRRSLHGIRCQFKLNIGLCLKLQVADCVVMCSHAISGCGVNVCDVMLCFVKLIAASFHTDCKRPDGKHVFHSLCLHFGAVHLVCCRFSDPVDNQGLSQLRYTFHLKSQNIGLQCVGCSLSVFSGYSDCARKVMVCMSVCTLCCHRS
jgi:hypothetical protein